jgi:predicted O-linked N-acetylglucosamine transferase (SPINDLY family)
LVVDSKSYADGSTRTALIGQFAALGIEVERLRIGYHSPPWDLLRSIDIALDCFPHNSGTTLFESLFMGVPFVTLAGRPSVGRLGASILQGLGHPEWIARSEDEYIEITVKLAHDSNHLAQVRSGLRRQMQESCLMDETGFTRDLEQVYREMFRAWAVAAPRPGLA